MTEQAEGNTSFGEVMFEVVCQRVGYSEELERRAKDPGAVIDVSGRKYKAACRTPVGETPPLTDSAKVNVLTQRKDTLVRTLDTLLPEEILEPFESFLRALLPLYDDGTFGNANHALATILAILADDEESHKALARTWGRQGYRPLEAAIGVVRQLVEYPDIHTVLSSALRALNEDGPGHEALVALAAGLHHELLALRPASDPTDPERTARLVQDLLFTTDPLGRFGTGSPKLLVRRDHRGIARVVPREGGLPSPFADNDHDGLPDADATGRLLDTNGAPLIGFWPFPTKEGSGPAPRDAYGRLIDPEGKPIYEYLDLTNTFLAGIMRDAARLFEPERETALGLLRGASAVLGPRQAMAKDYIFPDGRTYTHVYQGFDGSAAPLLELTHAALQALRAPQRDEALETAQLLLQNHEDLFAWLTGVVLGMRELAKRPEFSSATLPANSTLFEDLIPLVRRLLANQALVEDLIEALKDPIVQNLGPIHAYFMTYRDRWDPNPLDVNGPPIGSFSTPVDRGAPDSGFGRSINHRLFHLVHDTNGARLCSKAGARVEVYGFGVATYDKECEFYQIDSLAKFYLQSIARVWDPEVGRFTPKARFPLNLKAPLTWVSRELMDATLEDQSGITGFTTRPTTEALNRVIFVDPTPSLVTNLQDDPRCIDGDRIKTAHAGTIMAWEARAKDFGFTPSGAYNPNESLFYQSFRPIVNAFAKYDEEGLLLDMISVLYHHWSTSRSAECQYADPSAPRFCFGDGAVTYEPLLAAILNSHAASLYPDISPYAFDLMRVLTATASVLSDLRLTDGRAARPEMVRFAAWLAEPHSELRERDGNTRLGYDRLVPQDGHDIRDTGWAPVSVLELLKGSLTAMSDAVNAAGERGEIFKQSLSDLADIFLEVDPTRHHFTNPRVAATLNTLLSFVRERAGRHANVGDLDEWLGASLPRDVEDLLTGPVFVALYDLADALFADRDARTALSGLVRYLMDETHVEAAFAVALTVVADLVQLLMDDASVVPLLNAAGRALDPSLGTLPAALTFLSRAARADTDQVLTRVLRNMWQLRGPGDTPFDVLLDTTASVHRVSPGMDAPLTAEDYRLILGHAAAFFGDNERGLQHFIDVVAHRSLSE